jgi:23S rRNA (uracil1939-C5)-methyltransferase
VAIKQRVLEDNLKFIGKVKAERILTPIAGPAWHYRHRARLSARMVPKKGGVLVGFHEKNSSYIAEMRECILPQHISAMIMPLRADRQAVDQQPHAASGSGRRRQGGRTGIPQYGCHHRRR